MSAAHRTGAYRLDGRRILQWGTHPGSTLAPAKVRRYVAAMNPHLHHSYSPDGDRLHYVKTPQAGADAWAASSGSAQTAFTDGVQSTQVDVVARAIAQQNVMQANFAEAVSSGRWARRLNEVGTAGWKARTIAKAANYGTGIAAGKDRYAAAAAKLYPYIAQGQTMIAAMPKGNIGASKARAAAWIDYMASYKAQS